MMHVSKQKTSSTPELKRFLLCSYSSKEHFSREYKKFYHDKVRAKELYFEILTELKRTVSLGNVDQFKNLCSLIGYISGLENVVTSQDFYDTNDNPFKSTNLVILACKYNKVEILTHTFGNIKILKTLCNDIGENAVLPNYKDGTCHTAFYYALRSDNVELLKLLIDKWPDNYFVIHADELDAVLSEAYEEIKLMNVPLSDKMEIYVGSRLMNLRFFSDSSEQIQSSEDHFNNIRERVELVLDHISLLINLNVEGVNERFLFIAKFIAHNIHILKRQLKSTYDRLPWEEIEFCLVCFVSSHTKQQEMNFFYHAILSKDKILNHLRNFAIQLKDAEINIQGIDLRKLANIPQLKRDDVITNIINICHQFEGLYYEYQQIRDIYSLDKISNYTKLALSAACKEREGHIIITRVLQVIGEYLKNTLESPKLSRTVSEFLLLSLPTHTRKIVIDLRNSFSHAYSLSQRSKIEENTNSKFFIGIQNDIKKIGIVVTDFLYCNKIKMIRLLLQKIIDSRSFDEIKETALSVSNVKIDAINSGDFVTMEHEKIEKLIEEFSGKIDEKTNYEKELFRKMRDVVKLEKAELGKQENSYILGLVSLKSLNAHIFVKKMDVDFIKEIKWIANTALTNISSNVKPRNLKEIGELSQNVLNSVRSRIESDKLSEIIMLKYKIFYVASFGVGNIKWIEELREKLNENCSFFNQHERKISSLHKIKNNEQLEIKLSELSSVLSGNSLSRHQVIEKFPSYISNKKLQAVVEMLVLDVLSIVGSSKKCLENNFLFLDDYCPLLTGKCLRNHLAHDDILVNSFLFDSSAAVILNASMLTTENIITNKKKLGKLVTNDPIKLKEKFSRCLSIIINQERFFLAVEDGNLDDVRSCLENGVDINARSVCLWTVLHFAAKGTSLKVIKFLLDQNLNINIKDIYCQTALHIAATYGRNIILQFLLEQPGININEEDIDGKTALHIATQMGHKDVVEVLLKNKAKTIAKTTFGYSPLRYAIVNAHTDVVRVLLDKDPNAGTVKFFGGFTPLHDAADTGCLDLVELLLQNKADVNAKNDRGWTPFHAAVHKGDLKVLALLIQKGARVNDRVMDGHTPLHYAIEQGHEKVVGVLLEHGAEVNVFEKIRYKTPLHYAAEGGHTEIVKTLLANKANANVFAVGNITPLHIAAGNSDLEIIMALLNHGADITAKCGNNSTVLHIAANSGRKEIAKLLIKNKVEVNAKNNSGFTPLHIAALNGHKDIVDLLIKNCACVNAKDNFGQTSLFKAAMNGSRDVIDILIKNNADVNAKDNNGITSLHVAVLNGCEGAIIVLANNKAEVDAKDNTGCTPLHAAALYRQNHAIDVLVKYNAEVDATNLTGSSPLYAAIEAKCKIAVTLLVANGANVNARNNFKCSPLSLAIKGNCQEIVAILVASGANINAEGFDTLSVAVSAGSKEILEILLKNNANVGKKTAENDTLLHLAATRGHKGIVETLISRGTDVNAVTTDNSTPLHFAAVEGHEEVVEVLIANGANVNVQSRGGMTPLYLASAKGHSDAVEVLLRGGAKIYIKDNENRTPLEFAVANSCLKVVKTILSFEKVDINAKGNDDFTLLHIAAQTGDVEISRLLVDKAANIYAKNAFGSNAIHIAAREGHKDLVEFYLHLEVCLNEPGGLAEATPLHYTAASGQLEVAKYLIEKGADVNARDVNLSTPLHYAVNYGHKNIIEVLLSNNAIYDLADKVNNKPLDISNNKYVTNLLSLSEKLFVAVKSDCSLEVENLIKEGAVVNARNIASGTLLHYVAWKGYDIIVNILLQNGANPNAVSIKGVTPLHYAAKFSHINVVIGLLRFGAIYNAISDKGKTPLDLAVDNSICDLLKLLNQSFKYIKDGSTEVINVLNKIKDVDMIKAVLNANNMESKTIIVFAINNNFSKTEQLKELFQSGVSAKVKMALELFGQGDYVKSLVIFKSIYETRRSILGADNPGTLDIQIYIAKALSKQGAYQEALSMLEEIYQKQTNILGMNNQTSLSTRNTVALVLHKLGKNKEAIDIYREIYSRQKDILGLNHSETLNTRLHMALVLDGLGEYEEALNVNEKLFKYLGKKAGAYNKMTILAQNNMAMVLSNQGNFDEAIKVYRDVYEKKKVVLGINHEDTLRTLQSIAGILYKEKKYIEASKAFQEVLKLQKNNLGSCHPDTIDTQYNIGNVLLDQGMLFGALKILMESLEQRRAVYGLNHPCVLDTQKKIEFIFSAFSREGKDAKTVLQHLQYDISISASNGDIETVQLLLNYGEDVNGKDTDGRTPLHFAVDKGHINIVNCLLANGANATQVTNKGNTPLHTAACRGYQEIVKVLLQHVCHDTLCTFINAKTAVGGTTSLHVAAKNGSLDIVKYLLKYGAIYNIENREGKMPFDLGKGQNVSDLLKLVNESFEGAKNGTAQIISKLTAVEVDVFEAVSNARNKQGNTILQVAITNKHKVIAGKLLEMLKNKENTQQYK